VGPAAPPVFATVDVVDSGLGISSTTGRIWNCAADELWIANDCCYGVTTWLQIKQGDDYVDVDPGVVCECGGPTEPIRVEPGEAYEFDATPYGGWQYGGGTWRWIFSVSRCGDFSCPEELDSPDFYYYWEG
jgi:hypothetical protein